MIKNNHKRKKIYKVKVNSDNIYSKNHIVSIKYYQ